MKQRADFKELRLFYENMYHQLSFIASGSAHVLSRKNHAVGYVYSWKIEILTHIRRGESGNGLPWWSSD